MANIVDSRGKICPLPVIDVKNAIKRNGLPVIALVDNEISRQNVEKMANQMNLAFQTDITDDGNFRILIQKVHTDVLNSVLNNENKKDDFFGASILNNDDLQNDYSPVTDKKTVVVISSEFMGKGDDELGAVLMKGFIYSLTQLDKAPDTIILYNGAAKLSSQNDITINDLKVLEENGTEILTCGTCLSHYNLTDKLAVGQITNMYVISEKIMNAGKVINL